jgi:hypothetical protein
VKPAPRAVALAAATVAAIAAPREGAAADADPSGVELGVRAGVALPLGNADGAAGDALHDTIDWMVPVGIEGGYRFARHWYVGAYAAIGPGVVGGPLRDWCRSLFDDCSVQDTRVGVQIRYSVRSGAVWDPWFGLGAGYEWLGVHADGSNSGDAGLTGWEPLHAEAGVDFQLGDALRLGPFVLATLAQYDASPATNGTVHSPSDFIADKAFHGWLMIGLRGSYAIRL